MGYSEIWIEPDSGVLLLQNDGGPLSSIYGSVTYTFSGLKSGVATIHMAFAHWETLQVEYAPVTITVT